MTSRATIIPPVLAPAPSLADVARIAARRCDEHAEIVEEALRDYLFSAAFAMRLYKCRERLSAEIEETVDALPDDDHVRRAVWIHRSRLALLGIVLADPWACELLAIARDAEPRSTEPAPPLVYCEDHVAHCGTCPTCMALAVRPQATEEQ